MNTVPESQGLVWSAHKGSVPLCLCWSDFSSRSRKSRTWRECPFKPSQTSVADSSKGCFIRAREVQRSLTDWLWNFKNRPFHRGQITLFTFVKLFFFANLWKSSTFAFRSALNKDLYGATAYNKKSAADSLSGASSKERWVPWMVPHNVPTFQGIKYLSLWFRSKFLKLVFL